MSASWQQLDAPSTPSQILVYQTTVLYEDTDKKLWVYGGEPGQWKTISNIGDQYCANANGVYRVANSVSGPGRETTQWDPDTGGWIHIGSPMTLYASTNMLLGKDDSGHLWRYSVDGADWTDLGVATNNLAAGDIYWVDRQGHQFIVTSYDVPTETHTLPNTINGNEVMFENATFSSITPSAQGLFVLAAPTFGGNPEIENIACRFDIAKSQWVELDGRLLAGSLAITDQSVYGIDVDGNVAQLVDMSTGGWNTITDGLRMTSIYPLGDAIIGIGSSRIGVGIMLFSVGNAANRPKHNAAADAESVTTGPSPINWVWKFATADVAAAGYEGQVSMQLNSRGNDAWVTILENKKFDRNSVCMLPMCIYNGSKAIDRLDSIELSTTVSGWWDQWYPDVIVAWNIPTQTYYAFHNMSKISPSPEYSQLYPAYVDNATAPTYCKIFVWNFLGLDVSVGHASMMLSDGTYISWWPAGVKADDAKFLPASYRSAHDMNRTFADDVRDEDGRQPDETILLYNLDEDKICDWWNEYNVHGALYRLDQANCSTTIYLAIKAGGDLNKKLQSYCADVNQYWFWTPAYVLRLVMALKFGSDDGPFWVVDP